MKDIIKEFDKDETVFAKETVLKVKNNKGKINRYLLEYLNEFSDNLKKYKNKSCPISIIYCIYILAEFEEKELFPILIKIFSIEKYDISEAIDYCVSDRLNSILVSVFNGDFNSLNSVIENKNINDYIRGQFLRCYIYFYDNNIVKSKDIEKYLLKLIKLYNYEDDSIYDVILEVIINTHLFSLTDEVKKMFSHNVIDTMIRGGYDDFIDSIFDYDDTLDKFSKIEDTIKEMSWWYCFNKDKDEINTEKMEKDFSEFIENDLKKIKTINYNKIGRNDPCPCGSGKKYKKCCINKKELSLPYQEYINQSLKKYPKKKTNNNYDLYDFYQEDYIEIDKLLYKVFKHRQIPIYIKRDYNTENKINLNYLEEAFDKIKSVVANNHFKTIDDYDKEVSIHYSLYRFINEYSQLLIDLVNNVPRESKDKYLKKLEDLVEFFYSNFDLNNKSEVLFLDRKASLYHLEKRLDEGIDFFEEKLKNCIPDIKCDVYNYLFDLYMCRYDDIRKIEKLIEQEKNQDLKEQLEELKLDFIGY